MPRYRLFWKLYAGLILIIAVNAVALWLLFSGQIESEALAGLEEQLHARALILREYAAGNIKEYPNPRLQRRIEELGEQINTRLTVIRADGRVIADSRENPAQMADHANRPEIVQAREKGIGRSTRYSDTTQTGMVYFALPVRTGNAVAGYVRTSVATDVVGEQVAGFRFRINVGVVMSALLALLLGYFVARGVTNPLLRITEAAEKLAAGDYDQKLHVNTLDEMGVLARAFNTMSARLKSRMEAIESDRNKLAAILGGMTEGVVGVDAGERIVHLNQAAGKILGVEPEGCIGKPLWEVTRNRELCSAVTDAIRSRAALMGEVRTVEAAAMKHIVLHVSPLPGREGGPAGGAVAVLEDVTELRRLETVRRDFVSNVSHELKTPLTAVMGIVETLLDNPEMEPEQRKKFLAKAAGQSGRLSRILDDLLILSRVESNTPGLINEPVDLRLCVTDTVRTIQPSVEAKKHSLTVDVPPESVTVRGDARDLRIVVENLLDNAVKYTAEGGSIRLRLLTRGAWVVLEVEDNGEGIEHAEQERVFERFYRVDKGRSGEVGGTGLGLSIVKNIVLAHRGTVAVESMFGRGSTFRVRIPIHTTTNSIPS